MKKTLIGSLFFTLATISSTFAQTADVVIAAGQEGKGYDAFAKNISQRMQAKDFNAKVMNFAGSDEITDKVCNGTAQIGITQIDAVHVREKEGCKLSVVGKYGTEKALILFPPDSDMGSLDDLTKSSRVLVDDIGSGTDLYWHNIVSIEKGEHGNKSDWSNATAVNDILLASESLAASKDIDAVIMVTTEKNKLLNELVDNGWVIGDLYDKDINDYEFRGSSLYQNSDVDLGTKFGGSDEGDAYDVQSVVVANAEWVNNIKRTNRKAYAQMLRVLTDLSRNKE